MQSRYVYIGIFYYLFTEDQQFLYEDAGGIFMLPFSFSPILYNFTVTTN